MLASMRKLGMQPSIQGYTWGDVDVQGVTEAGVRVMTCSGLKCLPSLSAQLHTA